MLKLKQISSAGYAGAGDEKPKYLLIARTLFRAKRRRTDNNYLVFFTLTETFDFLAKVYFLQGRGELWTKELV